MPHHASGRNGDTNGQILAKEQSDGGCSEADELVRLRAQVTALIAPAQAAEAAEAAERERDEGRTRRRRAMP
jgi:hypothetical protein